jgi:hypothetical protein
MGRGKLKFKGDKDIKKKKKKSKHSTGTSAENVAASTNTTGSAESISEHLTLATFSVPKVSTDLQPTSRKQISEAPVAQKGEGLISSSGTVLMGLDTQFNSTLNPGDAILVSVPTNKHDGNSSIREEMRIITMRLSETSASISSAFSTDLKTPVPFLYIAKPRNRRKDRIEKHKKDRSTKEEIERSAFGTYQGNQFVYRERTETGGYRIRREDLGGNATRSDLLSMRTQKKSDKHC